MRAHYFQHVPFEGLGCIGPWLKAHQYQVSSTRFFEPDWQIPDVSDMDLLIVMGGPMGVNDTRAFPWLIPEKAAIQSAIQSGIPVLGICLGAQLMASALGAGVYPNPEKEIGWFPVQPALPAPENRPGDRACFEFSPDTLVFHWHGDTFDLPENAVRLARSQACLNQAFQIGRRAVGLQFHLETTLESAQSIAHHCADELAVPPEGRPSPFIQTREEILSPEPRRYEQINRIMADLLCFLTGKTA